MMMNRDLWKRIYDFILENHLDSDDKVQWLNHPDTGDDGFMWKVVLCEDKKSEGSDSVEIVYIFGTNTVEITEDIWINGDCERSVEISREQALRLRGIGV